MKESHPLWKHVFTPALNGRSELVCRRYEEIETDGNGHALSARALLAIGCYALSAQALHKALSVMNPNAYVLAVQIGFHEPTKSKGVLRRLSDDLKHLLDVHHLSNLNASEAIKSLVHLKHVNSAQIALQWLTLSQSSPEVYWNAPISVAQQHLKSRLLPHPRLGGYSSAMLGIQPQDGGDPKWQKKLFKALRLLSHTKPPVMAIANHHQRQCNGL